VRIEPIDERVEVHVPLLAEAFGEPRPESGGQSARVAQLVTAVGYGGGVACQTQNPLGLSTRLPVTRQLYETRYVTPDPALPNQREAVITLLAPADMAQGEILNVCIYWHAFVDRSFGSPTVLAVEAHDLVPPSQAMTEIRISNASVLFDLTDVEFEVTGFIACAAVSVPAAAPACRCWATVSGAWFVASLPPEFGVNDYLGLTGCPASPIASFRIGTRCHIDNRGCTSRVAALRFGSSTSTKPTNGCSSASPGAGGVIPQLELGVVSIATSPIAG
jgi:hypothetical protein